MASVVIFTILESIFPKRKQNLSTLKRSITNYSLLLTGFLLARLTIGFLPIYVASFTFDKSLGLLPILGIYSYLNGIIGYVVLDLSIYWQHRLLHQIPWLWRLHRTHHTDLNLDVSTGVRFHPFEVAFSLGVKSAVIILFGIHPTAVLVFEILLNAGSMFHHANVALPQWLDARLRSFFVTPDYHRIHHSVNAYETNSNYSFVLNVWDKLFKSYRDQPELTHEKMSLGLHEYSDANKLGLWVLLKNPITNPKMKDREDLKID